MDAGSVWSKVIWPVPTLIIASPCMLLSTLLVVDLKFVWLSLVKSCLLKGFGMRAWDYNSLRVMLHGFPPGHEICTVLLGTPTNKVEVAATSCISHPVGWPYVRLSKLWSAVVSRDREDGDLCHLVLRPTRSKLQQRSLSLNPVGWPCCYINWACMAAKLSIRR